MLSSTAEDNKSGEKLNRIELGMKDVTTRLDLYRSLYWANQGLLNAVHALQEAETPTSSVSSQPLNQTLRRTQVIIEETRTVMNDILCEWVQRQE